MGKEACSGCAPCVRRKEKGEVTLLKNDLL
jgi:hypothetical protein